MPQNKDRKAKLPQDFMDFILQPHCHAIDHSCSNIPMCKNNITRIFIG
jgi:hypothetical protein